MEQIYESPPSNEDFELGEDPVAFVGGNVELQFSENGANDEEINPSSTWLSDDDTEYTTLMVICDEHDVAVNLSSEELRPSTEGTESRVESMIGENCEILGVIGDGDEEDKSEADVNNTESESVEETPVEYESRNRVNEEISIEDEADIYGEGPYTCSRCEIAFTKISEHYRHLQMHFNKYPFICEICNEDFSEKYQLEEHLDTHSEEKLHMCKVCKQSFSKRKQLDEHSTSHIRKNPFICEICEVQFGDRRWLNKHMRLEHKNITYPCGKCNKSFLDRKKLFKHQGIHTKKYLYMCSEGFCNTSFKTEMQYERHKRMHNGDYPFVCSVCKIPFVLETAYNKHIIIHNK